jgi:hypothetical protein
MAPLKPGIIYTPFVEGFLRRHHVDNIEAATDNPKNAWYQKLSGLPKTLLTRLLILRPMRPTMFSAAAWS